MVLSGIAVELVSLLLCLVVGFIYGWFAIRELDEDEWPTQQMSSRGGERRIVEVIPSDDRLESAPTDCFRAGA